MSSTKRGKKRQRKDNYPTPAWCVRRLLEALKLPQGMWLEPCAGNGAIIKAAQEVLGPNDSVRWTAVEIRSQTEADLDRLPGTTCYIRDARELVARIGPFDVTLTNPPFSKAMEFVQLCRTYSTHTVMLLRLNFLASEERAEFMRRTKPDVYVLPNRPSFVGGGKTDSIEYAWFHWHEDSQGIVRVLASTPKEERIKKKRRTRRWSRSRSAEAR